MDATAARGQFHTDALFACFVSFFIPSPQKARPKIIVTLIRDTRLKEAEDPRTQFIQWANIESRRRWSYIDCLHFIEYLRLSETNEGEKRSSVSIFG